MTIEEALDRYLRHVSVERGLSPNTTAAYRRDLVLWRAHLAEAGRRTLDEVEAADVATFPAALATRAEKPLGASSVARVLSSVRGFHRFALEEGLVAADVAFASVNDMDGLSRHPQLRRITVDTPNGPVSYPAPGAVFVGEPRSYGAVPALPEVEASA